MSESSSSPKENRATTSAEGDGGPGLNGPSDIPEESVSSESDLALDNLDARREPGDKQGNG